MATRRYFQSPQRWTPDREEAFDFGIISKAIKIARKLHIPDLELVISLDDSEPNHPTPFVKFLLDLTSRKDGQKDRPECRFA